MFSRILPSRKSTNQKTSSSVPSSPKPLHGGMRKLDNWIHNLLRDGKFVISYPLENYYAIAIAYNSPVH